MKNLLFTIICLLISTIILGQGKKSKTKWNDNNYLTEVQKIKFSVGIDDDKFALQVLKNETEQLNFYTQISDLTLSDADLTFKSERNKITGIKSKVQVLGIRRAGEEEIQLIAEADCDCPKTYLKKGDSQFLMYDVTESFLENKGTYILELQHDFLVDFNPKIPLEKISHNWYVAPILLSAGGLIVANTFNNDSQEAKENYDNAWRAGEIGGEGTTVKQFYQTYDDKRQLAKYTTLASIAIPTGLALVIYLKSKGRKERMELQKKLNQPKLSWEIIPSINENAVGLIAIGTF